VRNLRELDGGFEMFRFQFLAVALVKAVQRLAMRFETEAVRFGSSDALNCFGVTEALKPIEDLGFLVIGELVEE
jgi:hypothetical protein